MITKSEKHLSINFVDKSEIMSFKIRIQRAISKLPEG